MTTATAPAPLFTLPGAQAASPAHAAPEHSRPAPSQAPLSPETPSPRGASLHRLAHGRVSLDELVSGVWAAVSAGAPAACPVCDGTLRRPAPGATAACRRCGSTLT